MGFKPDYGLRLWSLRSKDNLILTFAPFTLFSLSVDLEEGLYSTTSDIHENGEAYALTLDFDQETFDQTLELLPAEFAQVIRAGITREPSKVKIYKFPEPVLVTVEAVFGAQYMNEHEAYMPLRVRAVRRYQA